VLNFGDLIAYLFTHTSPGDTVELLVLRAGNEMNIPLTIGERP
jgi:S1-C subfamily serine protease